MLPDERSVSNRHGSIPPTIRARRADGRPPALERHTVIGSLVRLTCVIGPLTDLRAARSGMLICRIERVACAHSYAPMVMSTRGLEGRP